MNIKLLSIKKRFSFLGLYPYSVILIDLDTNTLYSDVADEDGVCKDFKPIYKINYNSSTKENDVKEN